MAEKTFLQFKSKISAEYMIFKRHRNKNLSRTFVLLLANADLDCAIPR